MVGTLGFDAAGTGKGLDGLFVTGDSGFRTGFGAGLVGEGLTGTGDEAAGWVGIETGFGAGVGAGFGAGVGAGVGATTGFCAGVSTGGVFGALV